jgi:hypothetical protein
LYNWAGSIVNTSPFRGCNAIGFADVDLSEVPRVFRDGGLEGTISSTKDIENKVEAVARESQKRLGSKSRCDDEFSHRRPTVRWVTLVVGGKKVA